MRTFRAEGILRQARQAGVTLLELVVYTGLIAVIGGPLVSVVLVSSRGVAEHGTMHQVAERNLVSIYRLTQEVRTALNGSVNVTNAGKTLTFTLPDSYDGVAVVPGDTIRYDLQLANDELANAADDNGNGLIDERGFFLERAGETVIVRLMLQRRTADGAFLDRTSQTSMRLRNRLGE